MDKYNTETLNVLEDFVRDMGQTADAYTTLGGTYLNCDDYPRARQQFNNALKLAKINDEKITELVAKYGLAEIDLLTKKIDEDEYKTLTKEIIDQLESGQLLTAEGSQSPAQSFQDRELLEGVQTRQCNCYDSLGRFGTWRKRVCIAAC